MTVVGVVKDHKYRSIDETPIPMAWYMYAQIPVVGGMSVEMRVHGEPLAILPAAQKVVQQMDPNLPLIRPMTQRAQYDTTISQQILFARLGGFFGLLAVVLVATGLYGTLAYRVNNRTVEIGVRIAVGARRGQVMWLVLRDSLLMTAFGVAIGVPLALLVGKALTSALYEVKPYDPGIYGLAALGVAVVAIAASLAPRVEQPASIRSPRCVRSSLCAPDLRIEVTKNPSEFLGKCICAYHCYEFRSPSISADSRRVNFDRNWIPI